MARASIPQHITSDEAYTLVAAICDLDRDDIDEFVIVVQGKCDNCSHRDAITITGATPDTFSLLLVGIRTVGTS